MEAIKTYIQTADVADIIIFVGLIGTSGFTTVMVIGRFLGAF